MPGPWSLWPHLLLHPAPYLYYPYSAPAIPAFLLVFKLCRSPPTSYLWLFAMVVPSAWNALPADICMASSFTLSSLCTNITYKKPPLKSLFKIGRPPTLWDSEASLTGFFVCVCFHSTYHPLVHYIIYFYVCCFLSDSFTGIKAPQGQGSFLVLLFGFFHWWISNA